MTNLKTDLKIFHPTLSTFHPWTILHCLQKYLLEEVSSNEWIGHLILQDPLDFIDQAKKNLIRLQIKLITQFKKQIGTYIIWKNYLMIEMNSLFRRLIGVPLNVT